MGTALAEGPLTSGERAERIALIYAAPTQPDLVPLVRDFPVLSASQQPA